MVTLGRGSLVVGFAVVAMLLGGCGSGSSSGGGEHDSGSPIDSTAPPGDSATDSTITPEDSSTPADSETPADSTAAESGPEDSSIADTGVADSNVPDTGADSGIADTGAAVDSGIADTGTADSSVAETSTMDSGVADTGTLDTGVADTGAADTGVVDAGIADAGTDVAPPSTYTVGGTVTGLSGSDTLALSENGGNTVFLSQNGPFVFSGSLATGATYAVTIVGNPTTPISETCTVQNGSGTIAAANVTGVQVSCTINGYPVGGNVYGLTAGTSVTLQDNGVDSLPVAGGAGSPQTFQFARPVANNATYNVTVLTQPSGQLCYVPNPTGTVAGGGVTSIIVKCRTGLVAYYPFDEGSGTTILDVTGNGNNGLHNATYVPGVSATALEFNGSNSAKVIGNAAFTWGASNADYTVDYWVWITTIQANWVSPFHKSDTTGGDDGLVYERSPAQFFYPAATTLYTCMSIVSNENEYPPPTSSFSLGVWTHFATVHSGSANTQTVYVNGIQAIPTEALPSASTGGTGVLYLGNDGFYDGLIGMIDEVRIYNVALSAAQVQADMQQDSL